LIHEVLWAKLEKCFKKISFFSPRLYGKKTQSDEKHVYKAHYIIVDFILHRKNEICSQTLDLHVTKKSKLYARAQLWHHNNLLHAPLQLSLLIQYIAWGHYTVIVTMNNSIIIFLHVKTVCQNILSTMTIKK
jgi:hypothetical protein